MNYIFKLKKIANQLDSLGYIKEASMVDKIAKYVPEFVASSDLERTGDMIMSLNKDITDIRSGKLEIDKMKERARENKIDFESPEQLISDLKDRKSQYVEHSRNLREKGIKRPWEGDYRPITLPEGIKPYEKTLERAEKYYVPEDYGFKTIEEMKRHVKEDIDEKPSFSLITKDGLEDMKKKDIGSVSAKYESGGDPGSINRQEHSYGTYQILHTNIPSFLAMSDYGREFEGMDPTGEGFKNKWQEVARREPDKFEDAQHDYIIKTHFNPVLNYALKQYGFGKNNAEQEALYSIGVQHRGYKKILDNAFSGRDIDMLTDKDRLRELYKSRSRYVMGLKKVPENERKNIVSRRYKDELRELLALVWLDKV